MSQLDDIELARALHVLFVTHWIGGVAFITLVALPLARASKDPHDGWALFVTAHPQRRKSRIKALFADERYLKRWPSDLELADSQARDEPAANVSWFAAEAYCKARGLKLPSTDQWEYAPADAGRAQDAVRQRSLEWFALPNDVRLPAIGDGAANSFGVKDLVGLV
jgi:formylglycine-generating enzyme